MKEGGTKQYIHKSHNVSVLLYHLVIAAKYRRVVISKEVKSIIAREIFKQVPKIKKKLWGGEFWEKGFFINTVGQHGTENKIADYVRKQESKEYKKLYAKPLQLILF